MYPLDASDISSLREALLRYKSSDPAISFEEESTPSLGAGFKIGFLGLLHMDVFRERIESE